MSGIEKTTLQPPPEDTGSPDDAYTNASLADGAYGQKEVAGHTIDKELSNGNRSVYVNNKTGKATVSFRGTDLSGKKNRWKDLGTDALVGLGLQNLSSRHRNAVKTTRLAVAKYGKDNVNLVGHSLGGSQALYAHQKTGLDAHAFNPCVSPLDVARSSGGFTGKHVASVFNKPELKSNAHLYYTKKDWIGGLAQHLTGGTHHVVKQTQKNAHSLKNFLFRK